MSEEPTQNNWQTVPRNPPHLDGSRECQPVPEPAPSDHVVVELPPPDLSDIPYEQPITRADLEAAIAEFRAELVEAFERAEWLKAHPSEDRTFGMILANCLERPGT